MQLGDASSVFLSKNGPKGSGLVTVNFIGHGTKHVNALELGLSELFEIGFWTDVLTLLFDFKRHIHTRPGSGQTHVKEKKKKNKMNYLNHGFKL